MKKYSNNDEVLFELEKTRRTIFNKIEISFSLAVFHTKIVTIAQTNLTNL